MKSNIIPFKPKQQRNIELSLDELIKLCYETDRLIEEATRLEKVINKNFEREFRLLQH